MERIYLDHNATTPLDPRVLEAMRPWLERRFGNASSLHWFGQRARAAVEDARAQVAALVGAAPAEIVFTSGGTEADNLALRGAAAAAPESRRKVLVRAHRASRRAQHREGPRRRRASPVETVRRDAEGRLDESDLRGAPRRNGALVSIMLANNETGVLQPVAEAAALGPEPRAPSSTATPSRPWARCPWTWTRSAATSSSLSGHKIYGPKGVGALYVRRGTRHAGAPARRLAGAEPARGHRERGGRRRPRRRRRPGREGLLAAEAARLAALRDRLEARLLAMPGARVNGRGPRLPNTTNVSFGTGTRSPSSWPWTSPGVAVSTGAACAAGAAEPSHVLLAMGLARDVRPGQPALLPGAGHDAPRRSIGPRTSCSRRLHG